MADRIPRMTPASSRRTLIADRSSRAKYRRPGRDNRLQVTREMVISSGGCWCGEPCGHDWPGKAEGGPHPRTRNHVR